MGQFHQRLLASNGGERHFCLESRAMVPARSSRHGISCSRHLSRSQAEIPLIPPVQISRASSADTTPKVSVNVIGQPSDVPRMFSF
ncbi:hypothetical protein CQZ93_16060 [Ochrobactrum vermis]|nr:hypothetical protein CQZ93_16060 [Ochrobactrum vermis]